MQQNSWCIAVMIDAHPQTRQLLVVHDESDYEGKKTMVKVPICIGFHLSPISGRYYFVSM